MFFKVKCNMIIKNSRMLQSMMKRTRFGSWLHSCLSELRFFLLKWLKKKKMGVVRAAQIEVGVLKQCVHRNSAEHQGVSAT